MECCGQCKYADEIIDALYKYSKYPVPQVVNAGVKTGYLAMESWNSKERQGNLVLASSDKNYVKEILRSESAAHQAKTILTFMSEESFEVT